MYMALLVLKSEGIITEAGRAWCMCCECDYLMVIVRYVYPMAALIKRSIVETS